MYQIVLGLLMPGSNKHKTIRFAYGRLLLTFNVVAKVYSTDRDEACFSAVRTLYE